jgi:hypothetical protein
MIILIIILLFGRGTTPPAPPPKRTAGPKPFTAAILFLFTVADSPGKRKAEPNSASSEPLGGEHPKRGFLLAAAFCLLAVRRPHPAENNNEEERPRR